MRVRVPVIDAAELTAALLPPPGTVTLESLDDGEIRGQWRAVEERRHVGAWMPPNGARYDVDLLHDAKRDGLRSLRAGEEQLVSAG